VGFAKNNAYVPSLPTRAENLQARITELCAKTDHSIRKIVLEELRYSLDIVQAIFVPYNDRRQIFVF
jgi:hypothetical protein